MRDDPRSPSSVPAVLRWVDARPGIEQNARDRERIRGRARNAQMGVMDGVESAPKNRQARNGYTFSILTDLILTVFSGGPASPCGSLEIFSTTS